MQKLNYVPNLLARSFRGQLRTPRWALTVPDLADPFFAAMTSSIEVGPDAAGAWRSW